MIWWLPLVLALPLFLLWTTLHECTHVCVAKLDRAKIIEFAPWPHFHGGKFYFGHLVYVGDNVGQISFSMAPYFFDGVFFAGLGAGMFFIHNEWAFSALITLLACPLVDMIIAVQARFRGREDADMSKVHWGWALPFFYLSLIYLLYFSWLVLRAVGVCHG